VVGEAVDVWRGDVFATLHTEIGIAWSSESRMRMFGRFASASAWAGGAKTAALKIQVETMLLMTLFFMMM
jgi:hypothetical protein